MTVSLGTLEKYAKTRKTTVFAHKIADDGKSATFVLESGQKLTMTEDELKAAISKDAVKLEQAEEDAPALTAKKKKELAKQDALVADKSFKDKIGVTEGK
jgi:hypothetical protein